MKTDMRQLHIGDCIYVSEGEGEGAALGVLSVGGVQMGASESVVPSAAFGAEAVSIVRQQHNYSVAR